MAEGDVSGPESMIELRLTQRPQLPEQYQAYWSSLPPPYLRRQIGRNLSEKSGRIQGLER